MLTHPIRHLICDLDNTLYDWVSFFVPAFYSMVDELTKIIDCDHDALLDDLRRVHRRYHDAEHPFAVLETEAVQRAYQGWNRAEIAKQLDPAFHAYNRMRIETLHTYGDVHETLQVLQAEGITLIAHSEAKYHAIVDRITRLGLIDQFDRIYCRERSVSSHPEPERVIRQLGPEHVDKIVELEHHQRKPSPDVLLEICEREGAQPEQTAYVGDSITKDISMAKRAGVFAIWARYGTEVDKALYDGLVRISHWTPQEVREEARLRQRLQNVRPDATISRFGELLVIIRPLTTFEQRAVGN